MRGVVGALLLAATLAPVTGTAGAQEREAHEEAPPREEPVREDSVPLYDNLGDHHYQIETASELAQAYFDQGLRLYYAFNHQEAVRSFRRAQELDPGCAMCWWGEALAFGPNINLPMDRASGLAARAAVTQAVDRAVGTSRREQGMIYALALRYAENPPSERAHLDSAYARAMGELTRAYPDDHELSVLYAEALMDLRPWDYWKPDRTPQPGMREALAHLERVVEADARHPGACHFFIHAVEKHHPERAVPCAERLAALMPGAGHLVHMPGHIYIRVGRYADAVRTNQHAVHADESYIRDQRPGLGMYTVGYYPNNYDFMAFASSMMGRSRDAVDAAQKVAELIPDEVIGLEGMDFVQHWMMRPVQLQVRFGMWDALLEAAPPQEGLPHAQALWHYGRGRALAAQGDARGAARELAAVRAILADPALEGLRMEFNRSADLLGIAERVLTGWAAAEAGRMGEAIAALEEAVHREDALLYGEPPEWSVPTRQDLGAVLLRARRWTEAEGVFQEDLEHFPENGWSLAGLSRALDGLSRHEEARAVWERFQQAWATADTEPLGR
jgi:tetratricopeptide (TPR) repeat protein